MSIEVSIRRPSRSLTWLLVSAALLGGCDKDPAAPAFEAGAFAGTWQGIVVTSSPVPGEKGSAVIDLRASSRDRVDGAIVMRWPGLSDEVFARVGGSATGSQLALLTTAGQSVSLQLSSVDASHVSGTFVANVGPVFTGTIELELVPKADLQSQTFLNLQPVHSMAFDQDTLWISTIDDDYILAIWSGAIVDTVPIFYSPGAHWTSDVLASGGGMLWGHIRESSNQSTVSRVLPFRREGILSGDFILPHLSFGLAHASTYLWSLDRPNQTLYRVTMAGAVVDSVRVENPDLIHLEWDGSHFWSMGWFIPLLWKIAPSGDVVAVYRLPTDLPYASGIAFDGQYLYCAQSDLGASRIIRLTPGISLP